MAELARQKYFAGGQERNHIHRATRNGAWLSSVPHRINGMELSQEEFRDNLCLRYSLIHQDIPATCDGCAKRFSIKHTLSLPKVGLVMARNDDAAKEWASLGDWALIPSAISYEPKIDSRTLQG